MDELKEGRDARRQDVRLLVCDGKGMSFGKVDHDEEVESRHNKFIEK